MDPNLARHGAYTLLRDVRIRLEPHSVERYYRTVRKAISQAGVEALGELEIEYSPHFERLVLHRAALIREGKVLDQTRQASLRVIDSEDEQTRRIYHGRVNALLVLSDVRVGDSVDIAYSINGENPVLGDRYAGHVRLGGNGSVRRVHVEVSSAATRAPLHFAVRGKAAPESTSEVDGRRVVTWDLADTPAAPNEDRVPATFAQPSELELSEFENWGEVARWANARYPAADAAEIRAKAHELSAKNPDLEGAVLGAIRFVQDDIRYLSISLGPHSVNPHPPQTVLAQRFGDCKDKSYLLVELLRALGVEARPALADTDLRVHLKISLPSAFAFDHVVAVIDLHGKRYYVDPTWAHQGGSLASMAQADVGAVLVVAPDTQNVTELPSPPEPPEPPESVASEIVVAKNGEARLQVTTTYRGAEADEMRAKLSSRSLTEIGKGYLDYYTQRFTDVSSTEPLRVSDERESDVITLRESYNIAKFWRDGERRLIPDAIWNYLAAPEVTHREAPLSVGHPVWIRERLHISLPFVPEPASVDETHGDAAVSLRRVVEYNQQQVTVTHEYRSRKGEIVLDALPRHLQVLADARKNAGLWLSEEASAASDAQAAPLKNGGNRGLVYPALFLAVVGIGAFSVSRVLARATRKQVSERRQDSRPSAEQATSLDAARSAFTRAPCECGAKLSAGEVQFSEVRLDGRLVHAARADCVSCSQRRHGYFALPNESE